MRKYSKYKESGIENLGEIPGDWKVQRLASFGRFSKGSGISKSNLVETGLPVILYGDIYTKYNLRTQNVINFISHELAYRSKVIKKGDLLFTGSGETREDIGKCLLYCGNKYAYTGGDTIIFRPINTNSDFLAYTLNSNYVVYKKAMESKGDIIVHIYASSLRNIYIPIPLLPEQHTIVRFLDYKTGQIDRFIANRQKQIELLKEQKAGIINKAVTKGINPNAKMKDSGIRALGTIPDNWNVMELKFVAQMMRGKFSHRPRNDEKLYGGAFPFIQTGDVTKTQKYITNYKQTLNEWGYSVSKMFPKGTVVITVAANIGDIAILDFDACFPDSIVGFYPKKNKTEYLFFLLKTMKEIFLSESIEGTQLNLSVDRLSSIKVAIPEPIEQQQIIHFIIEETSTTDTLISKYQKQIHLMQEYRTSLISQAVTGKIDVRDWQTKKQSV